MKTHYASVERGNESDPMDYWSDPICNTSAEEPNIEDDWNLVDCKKCLKLRSEYEKQSKIDMEIQCQQMGEMADYFKKNGIWQK